MPVLLLFLTAAPMTAADPPELTRERASAFARLALKGIRTEFPNKPGHVMTGPDDVRPPRQLHPAFYGCYDWHSAVHGHWMLARLLRLFPDLPEGKEIRTIFDAHLSEKSLVGEAEYFARKSARSFERPYGWAWLLKLAEELHDWDDPDARRWRANLKPLADLIAARYVEYFPKQTYAIRTGVHPNTAFGLAFAHDYARAVGDEKLRLLAEERAKFYFANDTDAPARWEPGGADFFSPTLMEADLMRRVLPPAEFANWFDRFLPGAARAVPHSLFTPATVTDRSDPQLVHLDGLNLSRAWCMNGVLAALSKDHSARKALAESAKRHTAAGLEHVASGHYEGEHWLASFAVYLLAGEREKGERPGLPRPDGRTAGMNPAARQTTSSAMRRTSTPGPRPPSASRR